VRGLSRIARNSMSTRPPASSDPRAVLDTVILRYFLFVERVGLLLSLLGRPLAVPRIIYDPDEGEPPDLAASEIKRSIRYQRQASTDPARDPPTQAAAAANLNALERIHDLHAQGDIAIVDLDPEERRVMSALTSPSGCTAFGLVLPLHAGEAACVAIAVRRNLCLATDDNDALKALMSIDKSSPYERIRRLLIRAADEGFVTSDEANAVHRRMTALGFRDTQLPFPAVEG
jgi:hypothetical protein